MYKRILALFRARNREFLRDRAALTWNFALPLFVILGFSVAFNGQSLDQYKVGVVGSVPSTGFFATRYIDFIPIAARAQGIRMVGHQKLDMLVDPATHRYWINEHSPKGYLVARILDAGPGNHYTRATVQGLQIGYVDWLVPGVLAMNMMFSALYGVGYVIVRYRRNGVLRRLKATPLGAFEFLTAQILSRLWLMFLVTGLLFVGLRLVLHFPMRGSWLALLAVFLLGAISLISLGLIVAARFRSEEVAEGILNLITWPMMLLSGVWFSLAGLNPWVQKLAQLLPLTHVLEAARAVMLDGAGFGVIAPHLLILAGMSAVFLALGALSFRWE
ncbi:ABC transporter permease [Acidihalobacter ferrooxydans]|uniref:Transport permease protein n=1 Tax=Acidihalobacter ferrooxydans TaxID=1765967 RepID=A0A1P8UE83_9GAMM|nr:ABC transporter permease [Acidihalobacter ferrooxydans]APZ42130.1 ABC transporter permease [Acidihalobacter ferrooxydans]